MNTLKEKTCCFTGHRDISPEEKAFLSEEIRTAVHALVKIGVRHFIAGGALGFDTVAAVTVLNMKNSGELTDCDGSPVDITLTLAVPCPEQSERWSFANQTMYRSILRACDEVVTLSDKYTPECMFIRNRYMVENSAYCIAYVTHQGGGSYYTMNYARKLGLKITNIAPNGNHGL